MYKKILCLCFFIVAQHGVARECFVPYQKKEETLIQKIQTCDANLLLKKVVIPYNFSVQLIEFISDTEMQTTTINPSYGPQIPEQILSFVETYTKREGLLITKLNNSKANLNCTRTYWYTETPEMLSLLADGILGACGSFQVTYRRGAQYDYKKIKE